MNEIIDPRMKFYTEKEVAKLLKITKRTVIKYIQEGRLKCIKPTSRCTRISEKHLQDFIKETEVKI